MIFTQLSLSQFADPHSLIPTEKFFVGCCICSFVASPPCIIIQGVNLLNELLARSRTYSCPLKNDDNILYSKVILLFTCHPDQASSNVFTHKKGSNTILRQCFVRPLFSFRSFFRKGKKIFLSILCRYRELYRIWGSALSCACVTRFVEQEIRDPFLWVSLSNGI